MATGATWISRPPAQGDHFWPVPLAVVLYRFYLYIVKLTLEYTVHNHVLQIVCFMCESRPRGRERERPMLFEVRYTTYSINTIIMHT